MENRKRLTEPDLKNSFDSFNELTCILQHLIEDHIDDMEQLANSELCKNQIRPEDQEYIYDMGIMMMYRMQLMDHMFSWVSKHIKNYEKFKNMHNLAITDLANHGYEFGSTKPNDKKD